jgi:hypothetical protein
MSLAMILGIDSSHFSYEESLAMQHAERRWVEVGKPANRRRLAGLLCSVIYDLCSVVAGSISSRKTPMANGQSSPIPQRSQN